MPSNDTFHTEELAQAVAVNSKLTAFEVTDCLEVTSAVIKAVLQQGSPVDLLGLGTINVVEGQLVFTPAEGLVTLVTSPTAEIRISNVHGTLPTSLFKPGDSLYVHRVNVCNVA